MADAVSGVGKHLNELNSQTQIQRQPAFWGTLNGNTVKSYVIWGVGLQGPYGQYPPPPPGQAMYVQQPQQQGGMGGGAGQGCLAACLVRCSTICSGCAAHLSALGFFLPGFFLLPQADRVCLDAFESQQWHHYDSLQTPFACITPAPPLL